MHIYCGDGKGKTTAAIGLAVRCVGAGKKVYIGQFIKDMEYNEISILRSLPAVTVELYGSGSGCFIGRNPEKEDIAAAEEGLKKGKDVARSGDFDLVIMDEINIACALGLVKEEDMLEIIDSKNPKTELVFTGRGCPDAVLEKADLVTEMREVRHYYNTKKLLARDGIER